jgi:hypothetical protein
MVGRRITWALLVGCLATSASAADRSASFGVSVQVVAPLRIRTPGGAPAPAGTTLASPAAVPASSPVAVATGPAVAGSSVPTVLTDGAPTAILER